LPLLTQDDILFYKNFGIYILESPIITLDLLNTYLYDASEAFILIFMALVNRSHYNDVQRPHNLSE